jgi:hypothetical protein
MNAAQDYARGGVSQYRLEPISDLDPAMAFVWRDQQDGAVVSAAPSDLPVSEQADAIVGDLPALKRCDRGYDKPVPGRMAEVGEFPRQCRFDWGRQHMRVVNDIAGKHREYGIGRLGPKLRWRYAQQRQS